MLIQISPPFLPVLPKHLNLIIFYPILQLTQIYTLILTLQMIFSSCLTKMPQLHLISSSNGTMFPISKNNSNHINYCILSASQSFDTEISSMCYFYSSNLLNCDPVIQFSAMIMNIDDKLANDIRTMSSNATVTYNHNEKLTMEQEIILSHMKILTHQFESTNPLHIQRAKIIAFEQKSFSVSK